MADITSQVDVDMQLFPQEAPSTSKKKPAEKKKEPARPTAAQLRAAEQLSDAARHKNELEEKILLVRKVKAYKAKFAERLKDFKVPSTFGIKKSLDEIRQTYADCVAEMNASGSLQHACQLYELSMAGAQEAAVRFPALRVKLDGPQVDLKSAIAASRQEWVPIMEEIAIEYQHLFAVGPVKRLLFFTITTVLMVNRANTTPNNIKQQADQPASDEDVQQAAALFG